MKRNFYFGFIVGLFLFCSVNAQINVQWVGRYTSAGNNIDEAKAMVVDAAGNSYVVGTGWNGTNFDIVTVKFDPNGILLWSVPYNGTGNGYDEARAVAVDNSGNVYVTGYSAGPSSNYDIVTIKYNSAGSQQWATRFDGSALGFDESYDIALDAAGNVYITGGTTSTGSGSNYVTIKYNSAGVQQWATVYSNNNNNTETAHAITLDGTGNVYITGTSYGSAANDNDIATIKYNNAGAQQWVKRFNGPGSVFDSGSDIVVDGSGNVFVTGYARDTIGTTNYSYATLKYNSAGTIQWSKIYDGPGNDDDEANAIALTPAGNVAVTGHSIGTTQTAEDVATILYDAATGNPIWVRRYDGGCVQYDEGTSLSADSSNRIFVTGFSYGNSSNNDFVTIKYEANGDTSWIVKYNGPGNNSDQAYSIALGLTGQLYVGGMSKGLGTNEDYAVVKYCQLTAIGSHDTTICLGASTQLSSASSYGTVDSVWWTPTTGLNFSNIGNPIASPIVTTPYVLHLRNQYGCVATDTITVNVVPLPGPQIQTSGPPAFCVGGSVTLTANDTNSVNSTYLWSTNATTQSITVNAGGTYSCTITNTSTCQAQSTITITVHPLPTIYAGRDTGFCQSSTIVLCATGGQHYAWTPSFGLSDTTIACPTAGPTSSTTYIVYGTDANGCTNSDTVVLSLYPPPSIPVITRNVAVLTSTSAVTYQWYYNTTLIAGATSQTYTPTQNGQYYVVITDANGCSAYSAIYNMVDVGMPGLTDSNLLNVFPNPNNGNFSAEFDQRGMKATMEVFDVTGQIIFAQQLPENGISKTDFNLDANNGIYLLRITLSDGTTFSQRMIVQQ